MSDPVYDNYWERKKLIAAGLPVFPLRRWWSSSGFCDIERVYFDAIRSAGSILDVGAGDCRIRNKFVAAGYTGTFHTQDVGGEFPHTYRTLDEVNRSYGAILCFDVIEHVPLGVGLGMINRMIDLLEPGGVLVLQTPNGRCVRDPYGWDMSHIQTYNLTDLWAYLTARGLSTDGYRIWFNAEHVGPLLKVRQFLGKLLITKFIGCDYADNIALVARKARG